MSKLLKKVVLKISRFIPDKIYLKLQYRYRLRKKLDFKSPVTFNEKLQWLKIYDRKSEYTKYVDKYEVRNYIKNSIGEEYLIPLIGVYNSAEEIDWNSLPDSFVLKCTHGSACNIICNDKSKLDIEGSKTKLSQWLKNNWYWYGREWPYKDVKPRIICEKYMVDESGIELKDYKFFCFDGKPQVMFVATDRGIDTRFDFFDMEFNHLPIVQHYENAVKEIMKPNGFDEMIELASQLSKDIPHVRVDFYNINGKIYFGELTFSHFSGFVEFMPEEWDYQLGRMLKLPEYEE